MPGIKTTPPAYANRNRWRIQYFFRAFTCLSLVIGSPSLVANGDGDCDDHCKAASQALGQLIALDIVQGKPIKSVNIDLKEITKGIELRGLAERNTTNTSIFDSREVLVGIINNYVEEAKARKHSKVWKDLAGLKCEGSEAIDNASESPDYAIQKITDERWRANELAAISRDTGLSWRKDEKADERPTIDRAVTVVYRSLTIASDKEGEDGVVLNCGDGKPVSVSFDQWRLRRFPLAGVIEGWRVGIEKLRPGQFARLLVEPNMAYGTDTDGTEEPKTLVYEIGLYDVH